MEGKKWLSIMGRDPATVKRVGEQSATRRGLNA
jgi:hypothetical protein